MYTSYGVEHAHASNQLPHACIQCYAASNFEIGFEFL